MGSSGEVPKKAIDPTPGGLVWVRRRNGSWWPGKILGLDELPEGGAPNSRPGSPVQLLGRENASVDWYNLEKSRRIKDFHCIEYDECIKKVQASSSNPSRRASRYARREDAILQALELENARLGRDQPNLSAAPHGQNVEDLRIDGSPSASHPSEEGEDEDSEEGEDEDGDPNSSGDDLDSGPRVSDSGTSFGGPDYVSSADEESKRQEAQNDSEDNASQGKKRMRGLGDLGMDAALPPKRKRSLVSHVQEFLKRKSRRRHLTKVMQCATVVPDPTESNGSRKNSSAVIDVPAVPENGSSSKLFDVPLFDEQKNSAGQYWIVSNAQKQAQVSGGAQSNHSSHIETISSGNEEYNESGSVRSGYVHVHSIGLMTEKGAFEWKLKGMRKDRARRVAFHNMNETYMMGFNLGSSSAGSSKNMPSCNRGRNAKSIPITVEPPVRPRSLPYRQSLMTINPKYEDSCYSLPYQHAVSGLYDVDIEVETTYCPQRVPYISLMCKLTGYPVVGHPIQVEDLRDSSPDCIIRKSDSSPNESAFALGSVGGKRGRGRPPRKQGPLSKSSKPSSNGLLPKKTKKLSSLTGSHPMREEDTMLVVEKLKGPSVACVPLTVVFSRINADLNSSGRSGPRPNAESSA